MGIFILLFIYFPSLGRLHLLVLQILPFFLETPMMGQIANLGTLAKTHISSLAVGFCRLALGGMSVWAAPVYDLPYSRDLPPLLPELWIIKTFRIG